MSLEPGPDGRIARVDVMRNPEKLRGIRPDAVDPDGPRPS